MILFLTGMILIIVIVSFLIYRYKLYALGLAIINIYLSFALCLSDNVTICFSCLKYFSFNWLFQIKSNANAGIGGFAGVLVLSLTVIYVLLMCTKNISKKRFLIEMIINYVWFILFYIPFMFFDYLAFTN